MEEKEEMRGIWLTIVGKEEEREKTMKEKEEKGKENLGKRKRDLGKTRKIIEDED